MDVFELVIVNKVFEKVKGVDVIVVVFFVEIDFCFCLYFVENIFYVGVRSIFLL